LKKSTKLLPIIVFCLFTHAAHAGFVIENGNTVRLTPGGPNLTGWHTATGGQNFHQWGVFTSVTRASDTVPLLSTGAWAASRNGASTAPMPWATFLNQNNNSLTTFRWTNSDIQRAHELGATRMCLFERTSASNNSSFLGDCVPIANLYTPTSCVLTLPPSINFGVIPAGTTYLRHVITGNVTCDDAATLTFLAGDRTLASSRVLLDPTGSMYADMDVGGRDGLSPLPVDVQRNIPLAVNIGATLQSSTVTAPGAYNATALVRVTWP
jgi:hypothetical protein